MSRRLQVRGLAVAALLLASAAPAVTQAQQPGAPAQRPGALGQRPGALPQTPGALHPAIPLRDSAGRSLPAGAPGISAAATCGQCHDSEYIQRHSLHARLSEDVRATAGVGHQPDCLDCHVTEPAQVRLGTRPLVSASVHDPADANCMACHGGALAERTGERFAPERISASAYNVRGREQLDRPFDVHAERLVRCVDCHHSGNHPARAGLTAERPEYLAADPRRVRLGEYLQRPSHELAQRSGQGECTACHDPAVGHEWLPNAAHHLSAVACQGCHVPQLYGPALRLVDWTVPDVSGEPRREYRNVQPLNGSAPLVSGYRPVLLPAGETGRLAPFNPVVQWRWVDSAGAPLPLERVGAALHPAGQWDPAVLSALDADRDGHLLESERTASDSAAVRVLAARLAAAGMRGARVVVEVIAEPVAHGVVGGEWATRDCQTCHSRRAAAFQAVTIPGALPPGSSVREARLGAPPGALQLAQVGARELVVQPVPGARGAYLAGHSSAPWVTLAGLLAILAVLLVAGGHALLRLRHGRREAPGHTGEKQRIYNTYERLWHWIQALAVGLLLVTGFAIHRPDALPLSFAALVRVHYSVGFLLLANAFLAAFYHVASGQLRHYLPKPQGFLGAAAAQLVFYARGMFRGDPHPFQRTPRQRLNPLQQVTYLVILNVLLPTQIITGVLLWLGKCQSAACPTTGLGVVATVHALAAWLFAAFLLLHIYLTTTGATPLAHLRSMLLGWEHVPHGHAGAAAEHPVRSELTPIAEEIR